MRGVGGAMRGHVATCRYQAHPSVGEAALSTVKPVPCPGESPAMLARAGEWPKNRKTGEFRSPPITHRLEKRIDSF